jgi:hypothetical protein
MRLLLFVAAILLAFPLPSFAQKAPTTNAVRLSINGSFKLLDAVALNAAEATRTITVTTGRNFSKLAVVSDLDHTAATDLTIQFFCSLDGVVFGRLQSRSISAGTATLSNFTDSKVISASATILTEYDVRACESVRLIYAGASGGASDLLTVYATGVAGE